MAEFATHNNKSASTKILTIFTTKNLNLRLSSDIVDFSNTYTYKRIFK